MKTPSAKELSRLNGQVFKNLEFLSTKPRGPTQSGLGEAAAMPVLERTKFGHAKLAQVRHRSSALLNRKLLLSLGVDLGDLHLVPLPTAHRTPKRRRLELRPAVAWNFTPLGVTAPSPTRKVEEVNR